MNTKSENNHVVDVIFVLALFAVFAVCALMLVSIGAGVYQKTVDDMNTNYNSRTAYSYVAEKIRQNDEAGSVEVADLAGNPALILSETVDEKVYSTYLYAYDGYLRELFVSPDFKIDSNSPEAGQKLIPVKGFDLSKVSDTLYSFSIVTEDDQDIELFISPKASR